MSRRDPIALPHRSSTSLLHLNPVHAKIVAEEEPLESYPWSSYPMYLSRPRKRPKWLKVDRLFGEHGIEKDGARERRESRPTDGGEAVGGGRRGAIDSWEGMASWGRGFSGPVGGSDPKAADGQS